MAMTVEQHERMTELCRRIQGESNPAEFTSLVAELSALLDEGGYPLRVQASPPASE
jgi:hypothetical protein